MPHKGITPDYPLHELWFLGLKLTSFIHSTVVHTVSTGAAAASVNPLFTVGAGVTRWAAAAVPTSSVLQASSSIKTRPICTRHGTDLTVLSIEALRARTHVVIHQILEKSRGKKDFRWRRRRSFTFLTVFVLFEMFETHEATTPFLRD